MGMIIENLEIIIILIGGLIGVAAAVAEKTATPVDDEYVSKIRKWWRQFLRVIKVLGYEGATKSKERN